MSCDHKNTTFYPGDRVIVFDHRLYINDKKTPLSKTMQPATVIMWYGKRSIFGWVDGSLIDVTFDRDGRRSNGHFTNFVKHIRS